MSLNEYDCADNAVPTESGAPAREGVSKIVCAAQCEARFGPLEWLVARRVLMLVMACAVGAQLGMWEGASSCCPRQGTLLIMLLQEPHTHSHSGSLTQTSTLASFSYSPAVNLIAQSRPILP